MNNIKLGIIYCSYGMPEYLDKSLWPWIKAKNKYDIKITAMNAQFKEYHEMGLEDNDSKTEITLALMYNKGLINHIEIQRIDEGINNITYVTEVEVRNRALQYLLNDNCDYVIIWDGDEQISEQEIDNLFKFLENPDNEFYAYFRIEYKNLINDEKHYIKGFNPKRIWKVKTENYKLYEVINDNDMSYIGNNAIFPDHAFSYKQISTELINPLHYSWLDNERSKNKINYQLKRWNLCSYKWNENEKKVEIDYDFYRKNGLDLPIIYKDE